MKAVIFGATGMVGQGALRECLLDDGVEEVLAVGRRPTGVDHPKLRELRHDDFLDFAGVVDRLAGYDACLWCLGISSRGQDEASYTRITFDYTVAALDVLAKVDPDLRFLFVSAAGASPDSRLMAARVKARAENAVFERFVHSGYTFRPAHIHPTHGAAPTASTYSGATRLGGLLFPVLDRLLPAFVTTTDRLGRAMLRVAHAGFPERVIKGRDLR
jgi:nucleoside-diphosphate-sugar epimerase